jgi:GT2 family glycosyltransferase
MSTLQSIESPSSSESRADVSVLIPVGTDEFLQECIESINAQVVLPREILLFVDGRTHWDGAFEKVLWGAHFGDVLIVPSDKVGLPKAWNDLLGRARGEIIAFIDADDIWEPDYLKLQVESLKSWEAGAAMSVAGVTHFLSPGVLSSEVPPNIEKVLGIQRTIAVPSSIVTTKKVFELVGNFDESFPCSADVDWVLRANHAGVRRLDVNQPLVRKRVHRQNLSLNQTNLAEEIMRVIRKNRP